MDGDMPDADGQGRDAPETRPGRLARAGSFLFDVVAFETDPTVLRMSPLARVHHVRLLPRLWMLPEPGICPDDDRVLAALCEAGAIWPQIRDDVRSAFDAVSRPGCLVLRWMVEAHNAQTERIREYREHGRVGGLVASRRRRAARANDVTPPRPPLEGGSSDPQAGSGSGVRGPGFRTSRESSRPRRDEAVADTPCAAAPRVHDTNPTPTTATPPDRNTARPAPGSEHFWADGGEQITDDERDPAAEAMFGDVARMFDDESPEVSS